MYHVRVCSLAAGHRGLVFFFLLSRWKKGDLRWRYHTGLERKCAQRGGMYWACQRAPRGTWLPAPVLAHLPAFKRGLNRCKECSHRQTGDGILKMRVSLPSHSACKIGRAHV